MAQDMKLAQLLKRHEAVRLTVYDDATGKPIVAGSTVIGHPTIGTGRNLAGNGISQAENDYLLNNDIIERAAELSRRLPFWNNLSQVRKAVLVDMSFMGVHKLLGFKRMLAALSVCDYEAAADEMLNSLWARQVGDGPGQRAHNLEVMMRSDKWPEWVQ